MEARGDGDLTLETDDEIHVEYNAKEQVFVDIDSRAILEQRQGVGDTAREDGAELDIHLDTVELELEGALRELGQLKVKVNARRRWDIDLKLGEVDIDVFNPLSDVADSIGHILLNLV